ncbi:MAG: IgGFc-binding protein [Myxococcota bacterium]
MLLPLALASCGGSSPGDTDTVTDADIAVDGDADATDQDTATDTTDAVVPDVAPEVVDAAEVDVPDVPDVLPDLPDVAPGQPCVTNKVCSYTAEATGKPFCATDLGYCVECLYDVSCPNTGHCIDHVCAELSCTPKATECVGDLLQTCNADGKSFSTQACPAATPACIGGKCLTCKPNAKFCAKMAPGAPQSTAVLQCNADGSQATLAQSCDPGEMCFNGACMACVPGAKDCQGDKATVCTADGAGYAVVQDCAANGWGCLGGFCIDTCATDFKGNIASGCDYWAVDLDNAYVPCSSQSGFCDAQNAPFAVVIANPGEAKALVLVLSGDGNQASLVLDPGAWKVTQPLNGKGAPMNQEGTSVNKNVYRIQADHPFAAFQFNPLQTDEAFSSGASLLLPSNGVGMTYWVMTREQSHADLRGYFAVVATDVGETDVTVVVTAPTQAGTGVSAMKAGDSQSFTLMQGQVLNIETNALGADLTGSRIQAYRPIAVFAGSEAANSPNTDRCINGVCEYQGWACETNADCPQTCCADHIEEQLFPVDAWGTSYVATKLQPRGAEKDAYRILASEDGTLVTTDPPQTAVPVLAAGGWFEFESSQDFVLQSNKPVLVGQFMASTNAPNPNNDTCDGKFGGQKVCKASMEVGIPWACSKHVDCPNIQEPTDAKVGDTAFVQNVPTGRWLKTYTFPTPDTYALHFVNLVAPANTQVLLDGQAVAAEAWQPVAQGFVRARLQVAGGLHTVTAAVPVGLLVYGWSPYVGYAYPGGIRLN